MNHVLERQGDEWQIKSRSMQGTGNHESGQTGQTAVPTGHPGAAGNGAALPSGHPQTGSAPTP